MFEMPKRNERVTSENEMRHEKPTSCTTFHLAQIIPTTGRLLLSFLVFLFLLYLSIKTLADSLSIFAFVFSLSLDPEVYFTRSIPELNCLALPFSCVFFRKWRWKKEKNFHLNTIACNLQVNGAYVEYSREWSVCGCDSRKRRKLKQKCGKLSNGCLTKDKYKFIQNICLRLNGFEEYEKNWNGLNSE